MDYSDTTVIIPVKDEPAVGKVARSVLKELKGCKVLIIYKGSRDSLNIKFKDRRMSIMQQTGSGKGVAVVQAVKAVDTEILCLIDGDATYDAADLKKVIKLVREGADMAIGNRLKSMDRKAMPLYIQLGNRVITETANFLYNMRIFDSQTGLRAMRRHVFNSLNLHERYFGIETEMNVKCRKAGYQIAEAPIRYYERIGDSKQMKLLDGIKLLLLDFKFLSDS